MEKSRNSIIPHRTMAVVLTLLLLILLEMSGLYLASQLGRMIRSMVSNSQSVRRSTRLRWLDVVIGYVAIFGTLGLITFLLSQLFAY